MNECYFMSDKTNIEASFYNQKASGFVAEDLSYKDVFNSNDRLLRQAHICYETQVRNELNEKKSGHILDYGCGAGLKNFAFADSYWKIFGIDISDVSISLAQKMAKERRVNAEFLVMDCEEMLFAGSFFDIILDYASFSSLDMKKALPQIYRVLKPGGTLIAIETFGHNPITNLKRWISMLTGRRTKWATSHIMKKKDWDIISRNFSDFRIYYFGFFVIFLGPLGKFCPEILLKIFEGADTILFKWRFLRKFAFRTVVVMKNLNKN
jgi:ubiquinone/menaquinone biosynthesis C-methylase UbiE